MSKVKVIAEIGINHFGDFSRAIQMCNLAKHAGADTAKFQWYSADKIIGREHPAYKEARRAQFTKSQHKAIKDYCENLGIEWACSLFHPEQVEVTEDWGMKFYKVASRAAPDLELLREINRTKKPVIMSTGLLMREHLEQALDVLSDCPTTLLYCVCKYPAQEKDVDLKRMMWLLNYTGKVGFSSHCPLISPTIAAVEMGASVVEHHVIDDKSFPGVDVSSSITFDQLREMTAAIREFENVKAR